jgi:hypothetical protein
VRATPQTRSKPRLAEFLYRFLCAFQGAAKAATAFLDDARLVAGQRQLPEFGNGFGLAGQNKTARN